LFFVKDHGARWQTAYRLAVTGLTAMAFLAVILKFLPFSVQQNLNWILMTLPLHWLIARRERLASTSK
jgi:hypothetical protein